MDSKSLQFYMRPLNSMYFSVSEGRCFGWYEGTQPSPHWGIYILTPKLKDNFISLKEKPCLVWCSPLLFQHPKGRGKMIVVSLTQPGLHGEFQAI